MERRKELNLPYKTELLNILKNLLQLHSIYVVSYAITKIKKKSYLGCCGNASEVNAEYTLLIINHKPIAKRLGDFMAEVYNKMGHRCIVHIIPYTLSNVKKDLNNNDNFLVRMLSTTVCIYQKDDNLCCFFKHKLKFNNSVYERIKSHWTNRIERARYLLNIIEMTNIEEDYTAKFTAMQNALEQICLGLLYLFWEFKPHYYSLSYLLYLCNQFTDLPQKVFPQTTFGLQRQFYMLCNANQIMRFKDKNEFSEQDAIKVHHRSRLFFKEAKILGKDQLKHLKVLHCKEKI